MKKRVTLLFVAMMLVLLAAGAQAASIRLGSTGSDVEELQKMLFQLGYYSGNADKIGNASDMNMYNGAPNGDFFKSIPSRY